MSNDEYWKARQAEPRSCLACAVSRLGAVFAVRGQTSGTGSVVKLLHQGDRAGSCGEYNTVARRLSSIQVAVRGGSCCWPMAGRHARTCLFLLSADLWSLSPSSRLQPCCCSDPVQFTIMRVFYCPFETYVSFLNTTLLNMTVVCIVQQILVVNLDIDSR